MLHVDQREKENIKHFMDLCPEVSLGEQVLLRTEGTALLEKTYNLLDIARQYMSSIPFLKKHVGDVDAIIRKIEIDDYILSGEYYNNTDDDPDNETLNTRNDAGDEAYKDMIHTLKYGRDNDITPLDVQLNLERKEYSDNNNDDNNSTD